MKKITKEEFVEQVLMPRLKKIGDTLGYKHGEYAVDEDFLLNFTTGAMVDNTTPEVTLWGYMKKHFVTVLHKIIFNKSNHELSKEYVDEKIGDTICYLILLEGILYAKKKKGS